jgi:hypothetical protein
MPGLLVFEQKSKKKNGGKNEIYLVPDFCYLTGKQTTTTISRHAGGQFMLFSFYKQGKTYTETTQFIAISTKI